MRRPSLIGKGSSHLLSNITQTEDELHRYEDPLLKESLSRTVINMAKGHTRRGSVVYEKQSID